MGGERGEGVRREMGGNSREGDGVGGVSCKYDVLSDWVCGLFGVVFNFFYFGF